MKGRLITLEGGEGAGKSTAVETIRSWLVARGRQVILTREPGGTAAAEKIRELLLDPATGELTATAELLLMFAARAENLARVIRPALEAGQDVICDRFTDASMAYQGGGRELGREPVETLASMVHPDLKPDLTLLLDIDVAAGLSRIRQRGSQPDRFEQDRQDFLERVRASYLDQAGREPERFVIIDAGRELNEVQASIKQALVEKLA